MMAELFWLGMALIPPLAFFGAYGAFVEWRVNRKTRREMTVKRYPEPKFKERITGDAVDRLA